MSLTGRFELRRTWRGRIVLQVEEELKSHWPRSRKAAFHRRWRYATVMDLAGPELRALVDLRRRPRYVPEHATRTVEEPAIHVVPPTGHNNEHAAIH